MLKKRIEKLEYNITPQSKQQQSLDAKIVARIMKDNPPAPTLHIYNPRLSTSKNIYLTVMGKYSGEQPTNEDRQIYEDALSTRYDFD